MMLMATYDSLSNGVVKDGLYGDQVATGEWSNLAHPWPLCQVLEAIAWLPREFGPNRENHIVRSTSVVREVLYEKGRVSYSTFDAPEGTEEVLRLAFTPSSIRAGGQRLEQRQDLQANGYSLEPLPNDDVIVRIHHEGQTQVVVEGPDPQEVADDQAFTFDGGWTPTKDPASFGGSYQSADQSGAAMTFKFTGNQVRLLGAVGPDGGWADAFVDGAQEPTIVECWNPSPRQQQPIFIRKGLTNGPHELKIVARGEKNPVASGAKVGIDAAQYSAATGDAGFGSGGGSKEAQRLIFGYTGRRDFIDSNGNAWRPGTEFVTRLGFGVDTVARSWWRTRRSMYIGGT